MRCANPTCGAEVTGRFCTRCGTSSPQRAAGAASPDRAAADRQYVEFFVAFAADGVIEAGELQTLLQLQRELGVSPTLHAQLVREHPVFIGMPLRLAYDPQSAVLRQGSPTTLQIRIENPSQAATDFVKTVHLQYRCDTSRRIRVERGIRALASGQSKSCALKLDAPKRDGSYLLEGILEAVYLDDRVFRATFELSGLEAAPRTAAPSQLHLHQGDGDANIMRVGPQFSGVLPAAKGSIYHPSGQWREMSLTAITHDELGTWSQDALTPLRPPPRRSESVAGSPEPARGIELRGRRFHGQRRVICSDEVTLGRDATRSDVEMCVEPWKPREAHRENHEKSMKISSQHLRLRISERGVEVTDISRFGSSRNGRKLKKGAPELLEPGDTLSLVDVLTLRLERTADGVFTLHRVDNVPERIYVLAPTGLGLWPQEPGLFGATSRDGKPAPLRLDVHKGALRLTNVGAYGCEVERLPVPMGTSRYLGDLDAVYLGERRLFSCYRRPARR